MNRRLSDFSGSWYPATAEDCKREIDEFLTEPVEAPGLPEERFGGVVPHAGWVFSGRIACRVLHALESEPPPGVWVLFGMHLPPGARPVILATGSWETPFGALPVAEDLAAKLIGRFPFEVETPRTARPDNTIELQLPFVNHLFGNVRILPIGAPPDPISLEIARAVVETAVEDGVRVKIIGSTDLTHYGPNYGMTVMGRGKGAVKWVREENDRRLIEALLALDGRRAISEALTHHNACCAGAAAAAAEAAKAMGANKASLLEYATSYDRSPGDSFVGYAGIIFYREASE
ncbi:MAG: AmmeMemoRadiSam system protein B [Desulfobacterales bacterium]